jgi:hypothetical protein
VYVASSPVGGFEKEGQAFLEFCKENGLTLHTCDSLVTAWESFTPSANKGPMFTLNFTVPTGAGGLVKHAEKLAVAVNNRRGAEVELNRLLSKRVVKNGFAATLKSDVSSIAHLQGAFAGVTCSVEESAIGGNGSNHFLANDATEFNADILKFVVHDERGVVREDPTGRYSSLSEDQALAIRLFTYGSNKISLVSLLSKPFSEDSVSSEALRNQTAFTGLLVNALRTYGDATGYYRGTAYRGGKFIECPRMQQLYDKVSSGADDKPFNVGQTIVLPTFANVFASETDSAVQFGSDYMFVIHFNHDVGVDISKVGYFQNEGEVAIIPPAAFTVSNIEVVDSKLVVTLSTAVCDINYI